MLEVLLTYNNFLITTQQKDKTKINAFFHVIIYVFIDN